MESRGRTIRLSEDDESISVAQARAQIAYDALAADQRRWVAGLPEALTPFYQYVPANAVVPLYRGPLRYGAEPGAFLLDGYIEIAWEPSPRLRYVSTADVPLELATSFFSATHDDYYPTDLTRLPEPQPEPWDAIAEPSVDGFLTHLDVGAGEEFSHMTFGVVNFMDYLGTWARYTDQPGLWRVEMAGSGWHVTLDKRPDCDETFKTLKQRGGYAVTHVGRLDRSDGHTFNRTEALMMIDGLHWFLSFVKGSSCGPFLPVGFDSSGAATWSRWGVATTDRWPSPDGWADAHRAEEISRLFPGFIEKWLDPYWRRAVYIGVGYYVEANRPSTVERAIGQAQVVLELLTHAVLVEGSYRTAEELKPIGRGIARLLEHFGISTDIPPQLTNLLAEAQREGWASGPWAVTEIRNEIIHAKRGAVERPPRVNIEAWRLISWYVELALLALFGFDGEYGNRLKWPRWVGEVEPVPWAQPPPGPIA